MLRPRNPLSTSQLNQENAHHQSQHHLAAAKTPARQIGGAGPSKGLATGGLTARSGRVLGQKDGNKASKGPDGTERSGKGTAQLSLKPIASTSACTPLPQTRTPAPAAAPLLPSHLCTPSPGVRKFAALSFLSPEVEVEMEVENEVEEVNDEEREVEICGGSSADYDEPFDPGFKAEVFEGIGDRLRSMPLGGGGEGALSYEEWEESDRLEREQFKAELHFVEAPPGKSTTSLRSTKSSSTSIMSRAEKEEARAKEEREAEEELGIFGVVDEEFRFEDEFAIEAEFEGQEEFRFDV
ncbi:hypothetical protein MNV49_004539 [Pseudohyphozyma bogoriensis]|nr:hypothetical protein MNV49_004539 [Pseudohyphozyma bogoriensis]